MEVKVLKDSYYGKHRKVTLQVEAGVSELIVISSVLMKELCYCTSMLNKNALAVTSSFWHLEVLSETFRSNSGIMNLFWTNWRELCAEVFPLRVLSMRRLFRKPELKRFSKARTLKRNFEAL